MTTNQHRHIFLDAEQFGKAEKYRAKNNFPSKLPQRNRTEHANSLLANIEQAIEETKTIQEMRRKESLLVMDGFRLEISGTPQLPLNSLESPQKGIYLLNTREKGAEGKKELVATVLFPQDASGNCSAYFADKIKKYRDEDTKKKNPKNDKLVRCINNIQIPKFCYTTHSDNNVHDHHTPRTAHGTNMCGIVAYGDLNDVLSQQGPVYVNHVIESVRILPETKQNKREHYGAITSQAVSLAEINEPNINRVICMAVSAGGSKTGTPSAWSAKIDEISFGNNEDGTFTSTDPKRLFILAAGNTRNPDD